MPSRCESMPRTRPRGSSPARAPSRGWWCRAGVRFDSMLFEGYTVPPFYDSLLGKLVVWDEDRPAAIERLRRALGELEVDGLPTTKPLHQLLASDEAVRAGDVHTRWMEPWL